MFGIFSKIKVLVTDLETKVEAKFDSLEAKIDTYFNKDKAAPAAEDTTPPKAD